MQFYEPRRAAGGGDERGKARGERRGVVFACYTRLRRRGYPRGFCAGTRRDGRERRMQAAQLDNNKLKKEQRALF